MPSEIECEPVRDEITRGTLGVRFFGGRFCLGHVYLNSRGNDPP